MRDPYEVEIAHWDPDTRTFDPGPYLDWLAAHGDTLPPHARAYATHPAHFDYYAFRTRESDLPAGSALCTKDLLLDRAEVTSGGAMAVELKFLFPGFDLAETGQHDLVLAYTEVERFEIVESSNGPRRLPSQLSHLMIDELRPLRAGIVHELAFENGYIIVESADVEANWR